MHHDSIDDIYKPAGSAGPQRDRSSAQRARRLNAFMIITYLYEHSSAQVLKCLFQNDDESANADLEALQKAGLIKIIVSDQQRSGKLIKLTAAGVDYVEAVLGRVRGKKYNSTSRLNRKSLVRHDISSQLYVARMINRYGNVPYRPETTLEASEKNKYFDIIIRLEYDKYVGVEIERSPKYGKALVAAVGRTIRALHDGDVDFVVFVLPSPEAVDLYKSVLDVKRLAVFRETSTRWIPDGFIDITTDDLDGIVYIVGSSTIWKGAL